MEYLTFALCAALTTSAAVAQAQSLLDTIRTPDKAVGVVNQTLWGTWLQELLLPGQTPGAGTLNLITFQPDGTVICIGSEGNRNPAFGLCVRDRNRKFMLTNFLFNYDEKPVLANETKDRTNAQLSQDDQTMVTIAEIVVMDR